MAGMVPSRQRAAVIVVRVWTEDGSDGELIARLTYVSDLEAGQPVQLVARGRRDIARQIERWLDDAATPR